MSIYTGLLTPYERNRSLTEQEIANQLHQWEAHPDNPLIHDNDTVIKMNSTYMEIVDRYYAVKGFPSLLVGAFTISFILGFIFFIVRFFERYVLSDKYQWEFDDIWVWPTVFSMMIFIIWFCLRIILKVWFQKTHYPIRFNRKNKMVYVYQVDGTILSVPWKSIFFTTYDGVSKTSAWRGWGIDGHILADDGFTVLKTFSLPYYSSLEELSGYWEFIRCYMEEDVLEDLAKTIDMCPPIADRKEGYLFGLQYQFRYSSKWEWIRLLGLPYELIENFFRYIAMLTSRTPKWPEQVEAACKVDSDDPFDVRYKSNKLNLWRYTFACLSQEHHRKKREVLERIRNKVGKRYKENY
ncbi:DUF6708 domain-containing protein [Xenorhabdus szentirmaii]|uniref:DUF6708 domain-containing protein n=1 Tax=Xenorhabdus szentirmaii DSM 16338 TaxID=1427518 RepID=W1J4K8_9GAMM|nr:MULTISPECIES: DUF6708 domain-containing protein [Xenorhabdus]MBD2822414.1 hypothetical protein [Xenorhabdus sp. 42]MBD2827037.1 hypothetical protein [Xenorhabdus sp. 5]PHM31438.1 hypothetical protein Xsze_02133 [Xenorhabdus szentirmaii DSM 16338]PHM42183.1 hypothetical protein Xszus_01913 [Xenorhabdus szentirmaii]CDL84791.1 conserved membrane hypothetical protein [Xenorhabdus szentirmaii DSM 16338]